MQRRMGYIFASVSLLTYLLNLSARSAPARLIRSIEYTGFIAIELFILWAIFKDKIEQLEYKEKSILGLANEAAKVAHEAIQLSKECG